ncbi:MarR family winged helix-turn-helix transcriptional regulator [Brevibacillus fluminis]|uniref:MarR family winged helix-turn-helix transcriptional regulator n=1 Tax=Brevibacillus fluminis TaxID=511487 RepID=UPI003F887656
MGIDLNHDLINSWFSLTNIQISVANQLEQALQEQHGLALKEFYMLLFLSQAPEKKLKLQQLESMVGLSQSAMSRLVARFEHRGCGALRRYACEEDRRSVYTALTDIGQVKIDNAYSTFTTVLAEALPVNELQSLLQALLQHKRE